MTMNEQFRREYMCVPTEDGPYIKAWLAYHRAADTVDGHLPWWNRSRAKEAVSAGTQAMNEYLSSVGLLKPEQEDREWQQAKLAAVRRVDSERARKEVGHD